MVLGGHLELANFVKSVHEELRLESKLIGSEAAWKKHCCDTEKLKKYSLAMKELATYHWENSSVDNNISRIAWIYKACKDYFSNDILSIRVKEVSIMNKINQLDHNLFSNSTGDNWKLLDVGSCYNPLQHFSDFEITAIDIAPALKTVLKCDFLKVEIGETLLMDNTEVNEFAKDYFDIVVFSLFLEYLPCPLQRKLCCIKAYKLLRPEGILVIITPDSNHLGSNAKYMKSWRFVLAQIGFSRVKYEKLKHVHCMVFRKVPLKEIPLRWVDIHKNEQLFDEIYIPQDFKKKSKDITANNKIEKLSEQDIVALNNELPFCDGFDDSIS